MAVSTLTKPKEYKEFKTTYLKEFKHIIPPYILSGLKNPTLDHDIMAVADSFGDDEHGHVFDEVEELLTYLSNDTDGEDYTAGVLYSGWDKFGAYESFQEYLRSDEYRGVARVYKPKILNATRCMIAGRDHKNWHKETLAVFKKVLTGYDLELFIYAFAITSPVSHPSANLRFAFDAYDCIKKGRSINQLKFMPNVKVMLKDLKNGVFKKESTDPSRRKVQSHVQSMLGETFSKVTVDSRMLEAYGMGRKYLWNNRWFYKKPTVEMYDFIEGYIQNLAEATGHEARQITAMIWAGMKILDGKFKEVQTEALLKKILCT